MVVAAEHRLAGGLNLSSSRPAFQRLAASFLILADAFCLGFGDVPPASRARNAPGGPRRSDGSEPENVEALDGVNPRFGVRSGAPFVYIGPGRVRSAPEHPHTFRATLVLK